MDHARIEVGIEQDALELVEKGSHSSPGGAHGLGAIDNVCLLRLVGRQGPVERRLHEPPEIRILPFLRVVDHQRYVGVVLGKGLHAKRLKVAFAALGCRTRQVQVSHDRAQSLPDVRPVELPRGVAGADHGDAKLFAAVAEFVEQSLNPPDVVCPELLGSIFAAHEVGEVQQRLVEVPVEYLDQDGRSDLGEFVVVLLVELVADDEVRILGRNGLDVRLAVTANELDVRGVESLDSSTATTNAPQKAAGGRYAAGTEGSTIFVTVYGPEEETTKQNITSDRLWNELEAVREGRVYEVSDYLWMFGIGYTAASGVIEDLEEYLVNERT